MSVIEISGGKKLCGEVRVQGSKNAVLPILAATLLSGEESIIHNCPYLADVRAAISIIERLGGKAWFSEGTVIVNTADVHKTDIPNDLMGSMRSSVLFLGPMLSRLGRAEVSQPGGCAIGVRPIDLHIKAFRNLGVNIEETGGYMYCSADKVRPGKVLMQFL